MTQLAPAWETSTPISAGLASTTYPTLASNGAGD